MSDKVKQARQIRNAAYNQLVEGGVSQGAALQLALVVAKFEAKEKESNQ